jgi:hypothetical protein
MSRHRSDLTQPRSAFDFDVVSDPPRPFKVRRDVTVEAPPEPPAEPPAQLTSEKAKPAVSPHPDSGFDFGNP